MTELNKAEAQAYLKVSERTLERYVKKHKVAVRYENTEHGRQPFFPVQELERVKQERSPTYNPAIAASQLKAIVTQEASALKSIEVLAQAVLHVSSYYQLAIIQTKKLLTIREAAAISGLSVNFLKHHLRYGNLPGKKLGQRWMIRHQDFDNFVNRLFK
ncbi:MAG: helix-turn-helix domain-containing protein [Nostoc sp. ChiSLP01]|nr:helix-turn-helix domain-containing protein [Nostoc sp. CmiSLP01]MDZ8285186.1 helix-turn-helix domain-containing protein [Nostoc sp. ChiSLP01]